MTLEEAQIIIGNIPIKPEVLDDCYSVTEYQEAKTMAIEALEQQHCDDCIRELIREFDKKHPVFAYYMQEFNSHPISEIIEYMWDMHELIEDIKYRLPNEGGDDE